MKRALALLTGDRRAEAMVPPTGIAPRLTWLTAAAMAFLAVFALSLSMATGRMSDQWSSALARSSTVRISAPADQLQAQTQAALRVLRTTTGVAEARALSDEEQQDLLRPWFGADLPLDALPLPRLIEVTEDETGYDGEGLRLRLAAEAPGAFLDDHTRWRRPLVQAAVTIRIFGLAALALIAGVMAAMLTLASDAALAANAQVIQVLRMVGARDVYIARAFVRRFTLRALGGAVLGTAAGMGAVALVPGAPVEGGFLTGLAFEGPGWLWPLVIPPLAGIVAFLATRASAFRALRALP